MNYILSLLAAIFLSLGIAFPLAGAVPYNPPPCTEDWSCLSPVPNLTGYTEGPKKTCKGKSATWTISPQQILGTKKKCEERESVGVNNINTGWVINGPSAGSSGLGTSATWAPDAYGSYTITWTVTGVGAPPCNNEILVNIPYTFEVSFPDGVGNYTSTIEYICRGKYKDINFKIRNKGNCTETFNWELTSSGDGVSITSNGTGVTTLDGQGESSHTATVAVSDNATRVFKPLKLVVYANGQTQSTSLVSFEVPKPKCTITPMSSVEGCPADEEHLGWTITNTGRCKEIFSFQSALGVGDASLTLLSDPPPSGTTGALEPGGTYDGSTGALINDQACGTRALNVTVTADDMTPVSEDGMVSVFEPALVARGDSYDLCPDERKAFGVFVKNNSTECTDDYSYQLTSTGDPLILFSGSTSGSGTLTPGAEEAGQLTYTRASPLTKAGSEQVSAVLTTRCGPETQAIGTITVLPGSADVALTGDSACSADPLSLILSIKNTGACVATYTYSVRKTAGDLQVQIGPPTDGSVNILPRQTRQVTIPVGLLANSGEEGDATIEATVSTPTMANDAIATKTISIQPTQRIEVVGRSWINRPVYSHWNDFPDDFIYPAPSLRIPYVVETYGTHNPQAYAAFLLGLQVLPDTGGSPAKDGAYRLWSQINLAGCCAEGKIKNLQEQGRQSDAGNEFGLPGTGDFGAVVLERVDASTFKFKYEFYGHPNQVIEIGGVDVPTAELGIQLVRTRDSWDIWHIVSGTISCGADNTLHANLRLYGSNFPTHELFVNGAASGILPQGAVTELWKPLPGQEPKVIGVRP